MEAPPDMAVLQTENDQLDRKIESIYSVILETLRETNTESQADHLNFDAEDTPLASILSLYENKHLDKIFNRDLIEFFHCARARHDTLVEDIHEARARHDQHLYRARENYAVILSQLTRLMELKSAGSEREVERMKMQIQTVKSEHAAAQAKLGLLKDEERVLLAEMEPLRDEITKLTAEQAKVSVPAEEDLDDLRAKVEAAKLANTEAHKQLDEVEEERAALIAQVSALRAQRG
ncbi:hypothetical protein J8273_0175 [Carpediemonas membranifera]|uniref:Uncharacterized protein n=1 Tax=Carpediemonas membranifera TaxID=201153 RepID=A0A8J6B8K3_9EUKA|nr:hypothetical protein J8273_0175 [Carpediemonas membranifera]|eukprot:KAG9394967.1 hypothetical protein J8273_0175 [Carpediemonas membranifera]